MKNLHKAIFMAASAAIFFACSAQAQNAGTVANHAIPIGKGPGVVGYGSLLCGAGQIPMGQSSADPQCVAVSGDAAISAAGVLTLATVNSNVGSFGSATNCPTVTVNAKGLVTAASATTCAPAIGSMTGLGTGVATFLATPSSANLRAALTDEVGTGAAYFVGGALGTPASATLTNATGLPVGGLAPQGAFTFVVNNTSGSASPTAVDIPTLTSKASPASTDLLVISDQAAAGALKKVTVSSIASAGSVASFNSLTGAITTNNVVQKFTASGTYTPTAGMLHAIVECKGSGGGGGGSLNASTSQDFAGAGGGAGSYSMKRITASDIVTNATITINAAGSGGVSNANGGTGGSVTVVSNAVTLCSANGGSGGGFSSVAALGTGGAGGAAGTGDVAIPGVPGGNGFYALSASLFSPSGQGGSGPFGSGGVGVFGGSANVNGNAGAGYGAGGSGASSSQIATGSGTGGAGSAGIVIITEFVNL